MNESRQSLHRYVCATCGYDGFKASETRCTIGEVSVAWFCPACGGALFRDDPLGKIEAEHFGDERREALGA